MPRSFDLPDSLPLFPLEGAVLMPRSVLPLQLFEPRYLQMFEDVLKTQHRLIGMIQPAEDDLAGIGCAGRVVGFSETDDGRMMIQLRAVSRFHLRTAEESFSPYLTALPDWRGFESDMGPSEVDPGFDRSHFLPRLRQFMEMHQLSTDWEVARGAEDEMLINSLAMLLPFDAGEKQALLEARTLAERRELLDGLIEYHLLCGDREETLQ